MNRVLTIIAAIAALATPASAADRLTGYYNRECSPTHICDLGIKPSGPTSWAVTWEPFVYSGDGKPLCRREFVVNVGGPAGVLVDGIAHGRLGGGLVGVLVRGMGRLEVRAEGQGCVGIGMGGFYEAVGD